MDLILDKFCDTPRSCPWKNGTTYNANTCSCEFIHLHHIKITKYGFHDCYFKLDDCLHIICITIFDGICHDFAFQTLDNIQVFGKFW